MEDETRRKVEDMVLDILKKSNIEETTEFTVRVAASERLGIDLSDSLSKLFVRNIIESYLISIATDDKPEEPPQVSTEAVNEPPQELNKVVGVKRKNDDSEHVICQLSNKRNVTVGDFKGMTLVSIREFYLKDGKQQPTTKGISLPSEQWSNFKNSVPAIEEAITKLEGRIRSGYNGPKNGEVSSSVADVPVEPVPIEPVPVEPVPIEPVPVEPVSIEHVPIEIVPIEIVRFDGKNYQVWAEQIKLLLKQLKINYVLTEPCPNATLGENNASAGEISKTKAAEKRWLPLSWKDFCIKLMREEHLPFWMLMECITIEEESRNGVKQVGEPPSDNVRFHHANKGGIKGADIKPPPGFPRKFEANGKNKTCYICGQKGHISKICRRRL
ncbi:unnamed protein product [Lathyrus sativus]|nr:unnamed protein product [Lathyrus sativus]